MTERAEKGKQSFRKAYGLLRRCGLGPLLKETATEEASWLTILTTRIINPKDNTQHILRVIAQPTLAEERSGNSSGNVILLVVSTAGDKITILSGDPPKVISSKKNGALKQEVLTACQEAAENPGIYIFDAGETVLTLIYQETKRKAGIKKIPLSVN